ncbi:MAG: hypothetical protein CM15mP103_11060 [Gammaproteobacteria bacterium]|nr:MAG: hypothetical protein CM15mP103_11060 [Gammaproteobacteria bacterium]
MKAWPALISGALFGLGLTLSGMSDPAKVLGFLNITGAWIPDLIFVMGGAVVVTLLVTPLVTAREAPLLASTFSLPGKQLLDRRLVGGAVLFRHRLGIIGLLPRTCLGELAVRLRIYRGVLRGHVRRDGAGRPTQPPGRLILNTRRTRSPRRCYDRSSANCLSTLSGTISSVFWWVARR